MSTASKLRTGNEVIEALMSADTPAKKAKATKLKNEFVAQRVAAGKDARKVLAGVLSRVTRLQGEAAKAKPAPKATKETSATPEAKATTSSVPKLAAKTKPAPKASAKTAPVLMAASKTKTAKAK